MSGGGDGNIRDMQGLATRLFVIIKELGIEGVGGGEQCRIREPYLDAFRLDKNALMRESVFVFVTDGRNWEGDLCKLPVGSTVMDAVGRMGGQLGVKEVGTFLVNGEVEETEKRLNNGDIVVVRDGWV